MAVEFAMGVASPGSAANGTLPLKTATTVSLAGEASRFDYESQGDDCCLFDEATA